MSTDQLELDFAPVVTPEYEAGASIGDRFQAFHEANPRIAGNLERLAAQWLERHPKVGVKALVERLRWESGIQTVGDPYRINNSYVSHYARLLIERNPEWAERIETRHLRAA